MELIKNFKESIEHFKELYDIAKDEGIKSALEYDFLKTVERHPKIALKIYSLIDSEKELKQDNYIDTSKMRVIEEDPTSKYLYEKTKDHKTNNVNTIIYF